MPYTLQHQEPSAGRQRGERRGANRPESAETQRYMSWRNVDLQEKRSRLEKEKKNIYVALWQNVYLWQEETAMKEWEKSAKRKRREKKLQREPREMHWGQESVRLSHDETVHQCRHRIWEYSSYKIKRQNNAWDTRTTVIQCHCMERFECCFAKTRNLEMLQRKCCTELV